METILKSIKTFLLAMVNNGTLKPKCMIRGLADKMKGAELPKSFPQPIKLTVSSGNPIPLIPEIRETPNGFEITTVQASDYNAKISLSFIEIHKK